MVAKSALVSATFLAAAMTGTGPAAAQDVDWWGSGWGHMAYGGIMMVLVWGGLILLAVVLVRYLMRDSGQPPSSTRKSSAMDILAERFARGEIDKAEYEEKREILSKHGRDLG